MRLVLINADSGWDYDYNSGSSDSYRSSHTTDPVVTFIGISIFIIFVILIIVYNYYYLPHSKKLVNQYSSIKEAINNHAGIWSSEHVGDFIPGYDKDKLNKFIDVQNAWMEFDYDALKRLCTDELYESYKSDLEILKAQNGKNIMSDFSFVNSRIVDIKDEGDKVVISIFLEVKFHDYVINVDTNKVTRGNKKTIMDNRYNLVFVTSKTDTGICPNCGAKTDSRDCSYCGSHVDSLNKDFVLSNKSRIR